MDKEIIKDSLIFFFISFIASFIPLFLAIIFTDGYITEPMRGEMYVYVPEDYGVHPMKFHRSYAPGGFVKGANNVSIPLVNRMGWEESGVANPEDLEPYQGKYIKMELSWGSSDDEDWYIHYISDVEIQNGTQLSPYESVDDVHYKPDHSINWKIDIYFSLFAALAMSIILSLVMLTDETKAEGEQAGR